MLFLLVVVTLADMEITERALMSQKSVVSQTTQDSSVVTDNAELNEATSAIEHLNDESYVVLGSVEGYADQNAGGVSTTSYFTTTTSFDVVFTFIVVLLVLLIEAIYLRIVSGILGLEFKLNHWLAFAAWSNVPGDVAILLTTSVLGVMIFISKQLMGLELSTLTRMIEGPSYPYHPLEYFLSFWHVAAIWHIVVQTIGFRAWSGKSTLVSLAIVVVPFVFLIALDWWYLTLV